MQKNVFGGDFPTEHNSVAGYKSSYEKHSTQLLRAITHIKNLEIFFQCKFAQAYTLAKGLPSWLVFIIYSKTSGKYLYRNTLF